MNIWIDCEFNSFRGKLISLALVAQDGREFYDALVPSRIAATMDLDPWVAEHVMPLLSVSTAVPYYVDSMVEMQADMAAFLAHYETVHIIADWPADIQHFCDLLLCEDAGMRIDTPPLTMEIIRLDGKSQYPHNALCDARGLKAVHLAPTPAKVVA